MHQDVQAVVTMTERALPEDWTRDMDYLHVPTPDFTAPDVDRLDEAVSFIHEQIQQNRPVMVSTVQPGLGRAGTVLACYFVRHHGYSADAAITMIREKRPGSVQSEAQETAIKYYEKCSN